MMSLDRINISFDALKDAAKATGLNQDEVDEMRKLAIAGFDMMPQEDYILELEQKVEALEARTSPEGTVVLPVELVRKILAQHEMAADALVDSWGDIHREIVAELHSRVPQEQEGK